MKDYDQMLYDILKPLVTGEDNPVRLYRNTVTDDYDSQPEDYVIYSTGISNTPRIFGDGKVLARRCSCDVTVNEMGNGNNETAGYLIRRVESLLIAAGIAYTKINLGYIESMDSMQTTFDFYLI